MADTLLNRTPFTIRLRRMTAQALSALSQYLQYEGEPAYSTDTKQMFVSDGTYFNPVQTVNLMMCHDDDLVFHLGEPVIHF
jgi:hypothetical protein